MTETAIQIGDKLKRHAKQLFDKACELAQIFTRKWSDVGQVAAEVKEKDLWKPLGFKDLDAWRGKVGLGRSTMYACMRCYNSLKSKLSKSQMQRIPRQNAEHLIKLPEKQRFSRQWIEWAMELTEDEFENKVKAFLDKPDRVKDASEAENRTKLVVRCYASQKQFIEETLQEWSSNNNLGTDTGRALELICAEVRSGFEEERKHLMTQMGIAFKAFIDRTKELRDILGGDQAADEQLQLIGAVVLKQANQALDVTKNFGEQIQLADWTNEVKQKRNGRVGKKAKQHAVEVIDGGKAKAAAAGTEASTVQ